MMPERTSIFLPFGDGAEELLDVLLGAEAHHALDARAVVPAAIEEDDLAGGRQVRHISLEIPLRALALARRRQRHDAADARIEALRDPLDDAALAGGVAPFEDDDDLELPVDHPVLQLHQLPLQPKQLLEIEVPIDGLLFGAVGPFIQEPGQALVVDLQLQLLVEAVGDLGVDAAQDPAWIPGLVFAHGQPFSVRSHGNQRSRQDSAMLCPVHDTGKCGLTNLQHSGHAIYQYRR
jgi:hypothetical protein